jgi:NAD(P)-dependent dehydrogenase (short-subunit alcohol dehydrogenase family)
LAQRQAARFSGNEQNEEKEGFRMSFIQGGVAVVTGAGSGIGRALAQRLAAAGSALALADIDEKGLQETAASLGAKTAKVTTHVLNVAEEAAVRHLAEEVVEEHGRVTLLINNAGVALIGRFEEISLGDLRWLMDINFWGTVYGVRYFLPVLKQQPRAHIVNLSSVFGLIAPVGQSAYCSSKFAVRGFTECLRHELEGTNVSVTSVHPGGIATAIARKARLGANTPQASQTQSVSLFEKVARIPPEEAADAVLRGVERRQGRVLIGTDARFLDLLQRLRPATYWKTLAKRYESAGTVKQ